MVSGPESLKILAPEALSIASMWKGWEEGVTSNDFSKPRVVLSLTFSYDCVTVQTLAPGSGDPPYFRGGGQENLERGPLAYLAVHRNRPVHSLNDVLYD